MTLKGWRDEGFNVHMLSFKGPRGNANSSFQEAVVYVGWEVRLETTI